MNHLGNLLATDAAATSAGTVELRLPVAVSVEPDVDGDGFGDETQDECPQSAALQTECAQIGLDEFATAGRSAATVILIADHEAPVTVTEKVKTVSSKGSKRGTRAAPAIALKGGTQTVARESSPDSS